MELIRRFHFNQRGKLPQCLVVLLALADCSAGGGDSRPPEPPDLSATAPFADGFWAVRLSFGVDDPDGGTDPGLEVLALRQAIADLPGSAAANWHLCGLSLPGGHLYVPFDDAGLGPTIISTRGTLTGTRFVEPDVVVIGGALLLDGNTDRLPSAGWCDRVSPPCVQFNPITQIPGLRATGSGLVPDAREVYVDLRLKFFVDSTVDDNGHLAGTLGTDLLEWHVVDCVLGGLRCQPAEIAALEATQPRISLGPGTIRARIAPDNLDCHALTLDPGGWIDRP